MDGVELAKQSWAYGLLLASLQILAVSLVCYLRFVVELFRRREYLVGGIFAAFFVLVGGGWTLGLLAGLPLGWRYARRWQIGGWMVLWTISLVLSLANLAAGAFLLSLPTESWQRNFGWVPSF